MHYVVTGASGALGSAVVERLKKVPGATVHTPGRADLAHEMALTAFYAALPPIWASIHTIGSFSMAKIEDTSLAEFENQWRTNTVTAFLCCREAVRSIKRSGAGGRIVNIGARPVVSPVAQMTAYAASKAGVASLTQTLAAELVADKILVNAVLPSLFGTPKNLAAMPNADHDAWPTPAQVAETIAFLASPENVLTSGALVPVYGRS